MEVDVMLVVEELCWLWFRLADDVEFLSGAYWGYMFKARGIVVLIWPSPGIKEKNCFTSVGPSRLVVQ